MLTIKGENLLKLVITIGVSSLRIENCNKNPISTLHINKINRGHLRFQSPS